MPATRRTLTCLIALLVLSPPCAAVPNPGEPFGVVVGSLRVADRLLYETVSEETWGDSPGANPGPLRPTERSQTVILVEGTGTQRDRYGLERPVETLRFDTIEGEEATRMWRCHLLRGGREAVRVETLLGNSYGGTWELPGTLLTGSTTQESTSTPRLSFEGACDVDNHLGGRTLLEGDRLRLSEFLWLGPQMDADPPLSLPGRPTQIHGRDALVFSFTQEGSEGALPDVQQIDVTVVDGLPWVFSMHVVDPRGEDRTAHHWVTLQGYERGEGAELAPASGAALPPRNPASPYFAFDRLRLDTSAFQLPFPYEAAWDALLQDPDPRFRLWLDAHPDAFLLAAEYDRRARIQGSLGVDVATDGAWALHFLAAAGSAFVHVSRPAGVGLPTGTSHLPQPGPPVVEFTESPEGLHALQASAPAEMAPSATLAALTAGEGIAPEQIASFQYELWLFRDSSRPMVVVTSQPEGTEAEASETSVTLEPAKGGLREVTSTTLRTQRHGGLLTPPSGADLASEEPSRALALLASPAPGAGFAIGAATTGLVVLALLLVKLLLPLYTRLRRERLLEHPARAALVDRVRAEPGMHAAALAAAVGGRPGTVRHHLRQLVRHKALVEARDGQYVRYFVPGQAQADEALRAALLRNGTLRRVFEAYAAEPGLSLREAGRRLGISAPSVHRARKRLVEAGLMGKAAPGTPIKPEGEGGAGSR